MMIRSPHLRLSLPVPEERLTFCEQVKGNYDYWHYGCDGVDDRGWGCGYRTLQTICSWIIGNAHNVPHSAEVPSVKQIQEALVALQDKPESFLQSREWIGCCEAGLVTDYLFNVPCKLLHVRRHEGLRQVEQQLISHFRHFSSPVMMGGDADSSSKGIFGICGTPQETHLLVVDPHYYSAVGDGENKYSDWHPEDWISWKHVDHDFVPDSFYNLCLPQIRAMYSPQASNSPR